MNTQTVLALQVLRELKQSYFPQTIAALAPKLGLKGDYTAKLLRILREAGFVTSTRGGKGGYALARPARSVRVLDVVRKIENGILPDQPGDSAAVQRLRQKLREPISEVLKSLTIADL